MRTLVHTRTPQVTYTPRPARTVAGLAPGQKPAHGELEKRCPYIASTPEQNSRTNVADIVGSHVYRTTVLNSVQPVGCRFYFYAPPYEAIVDIVPQTLSSPTAANNAMVLTARAGSQAQGHPNLLPGIDAVVFRTKFFGPDTGRDWASAFSKGSTMVVIHTQRTDTSYPALLLAKAIAPKF